MTGTEALVILAHAEELLAAQHAELAVADDDLSAAELLGQEITHLLTSIANAGPLEQLDDDLRARLHAAAGRASEQLAAASATVLRLRSERLDEQARAEREGAAVRRYLPPHAQPSAQFLDERR